MDSSLNIPRGLKPVLLEGTDGRYDNYFEFVRWSLEEAIEAWEGSYEGGILRHRTDPKYGSHATWVSDFSGTLTKCTYVISETKNSEWCFVAPLVDDQRNGPFLPTAFDGFYLARRTQHIRVNYAVRNQEAPIVSFEHHDYRYGKTVGQGLLRKRWVQRFRGKFDSEEAKATDFDFPGDVPFEGRGWKKLDHEKVYSLCGGMGLDLLDPGLLSGRYVLVVTHLVAS